MHYSKHNEHHIKASTMYLEDTFEKETQILETEIQMCISCWTMYVCTNVNIFYYWRIQMSRLREPSLAIY